MEDGSGFSSREEVDSILTDCRTVADETNPQNESFQHIALRLHDMVPAAWAHRRQAVGLVPLTLRQYWQDILGFTRERVRTDAQANAIISTLIEGIELSLGQFLLINVLGVMVNAIYGLEHDGSPVEIARKMLVCFEDMLDNDLRVTEETYITLSQMTRLVRIDDAELRNEFAGFDFHADNLPRPPLEILESALLRLEQQPLPLIWNENQACVLCHKAIGSDINLRLMQSACTHLAHPDCVRKWLRTTSRDCPHCHRPLSEPCLSSAGSRNSGTHSPGQSARYSMEQFRLERGFQNVGYSTRRPRNRTHWSIRQIWRSISPYDQNGGLSPTEKRVHWS